MRIKGWSKFQHFKDRTPPWIKLYRGLLDDPDFHALDGDSAKLLVMIWLVASEDETHQGTLPCDKKLAFRLRIAERQLKQALTKLSHWLIQDDISVISDRYQVDAPETETETETDTRNANVSFDPKTYMIELGVDEQFIKDWFAIRKLKKLPSTQTALAGVVAEVEKAGWEMNNAIRVCCEKGWAGFKAAWVKDEVQPGENNFMAKMGFA